MSILRIKCFGDLQVELNGETVSNFETDKARALLVYLAIESARPLQRSHIAGMLWSEEAEERALHNLRQTLSSLRKTLGDSANTPRFILADRDSIRINPSADVWIDTIAFIQYLSCAYRHYQRRIGRGSFNVRYLQKALKVYRGQFLHSFQLSKCALFEEWVLLQREDYNLQAIRALTLLAEYHERRDEYHLAIQSAIRVVEISPWDETARAQVIRLLGINQQWSAAKSQFFALKKYLSEQLSVSPAAEVITLYEQICKGAAGKAAVLPGFPPEKYNLPDTASSFIGREAELDEVMEKIISPDNRLITLIGPGGIGKTRFAIEIAYQLVGILADGVFFVSLVTAQNPEQIVQLIAESIGFIFSDQFNPQKQLMDHLRDKQLLLVLDNFEHLLANSRNTLLLDKIINQVPQTTFLVTSREQLNLHQERIFALPGLSYPQEIKVPLEEITSYDALNLFVRQALRKQQNFLLDETNLHTVIRICRTLEGLPLGVELAAAAICEQGYEAVARKIENDLDALATSTANIQPRHRSLHAAFEVSWELLPQRQQIILSRLSVFPDGFDHIAAKAISGASAAELSSLAAKSLLRVDKFNRFSFHEAIRHFVSKKPISTENFVEVRERHALFYVSFLAGKNNLLQSDGQTAALADIQSEYGNVHLAWNWLIDHQRAAEMICCMDSLYQFFNIQSYLEEGIQWFQQALKNIGNKIDNSLVLGMLLSRLGSLAYHARKKDLMFQSLLRSQELLRKANAGQELAFCWFHLGWAYQREKDFITAQHYAENSLEYFQHAGDVLGQSQALTLLGSIQNRQGSNPEAKNFFDKALILCRRSGNQRLLITILNRLGDLACYAGEYQAAIEQFSECLEISERLNDRYNQAILLNNMGTIYHVWKDYPQAQSCYQKSLVLCREIGDQDGIALALNNLGELSTVQGDYPSAIKYSKDALQIAEQLQEAWTIIVCLNSLGEIYCAMNDLEKSKNYFLKALRQALMVNAIDLVARVSVNTARVFQLMRDYCTATLLLQAALAHSSTEHDAREKAVDWLKEMNASSAIENNDLLLVKDVKSVLNFLPK